MYLKVRMYVCRSMYVCIMYIRVFLQHDYYRWFSWTIADYSRVSLTSARRKPLSHKHTPIIIRHYCTEFYIVLFFILRSQQALILPVTLPQCGRAVLDYMLLIACHCICSQLMESNVSSKSLLGEEGVLTLEMIWKKLVQIAVKEM
jgi:hypothetical protein